MVSNLCGRRCRYTTRWDASGVGIVRAVYADPRPDHVARVLVEVVAPDGSGDVGEVLDLHIQEITLTQGGE